MVKSAGPGTRPRGGGLWTALPLSSLIVAEVFALALYAILRLNGVAQMQATVSSVAVAVLGAILAISTSSLISVWGRLGRRSGFIRRRFGRADDPPVPFDVPVSDGTLMGLRWVDGRLISIIRLSRPVEPRILTPSQTVVAGSGLKLGVIARALAQFDIELESIDVVAHGWRARGAAHVTAPYYTLTGSLPAVPQQEVFVVLRLDPLLCPDAIASRGGGPTGVIRTAVTATRRVGNHLARQGYRTRILTAGEISAVGARLIDGASVDAAAENWSNVRYGNYKTTAYAVPGLLDEQVLTDIWSTSALSTTTSTTVTRVDDAEFAVATVVRYGTAGELELAVPERLQLLAGQQELAVAWTIPAQRSGLRRLPVTTSGLALLDETAVPDGGSGQLLGADQSGAAVAVPLFGADVRRVDVHGEAYLILQIVTRSLALGARVLVRTDRPDIWRPLLTGVNDPQTLYVSTSATDQRFSTNTYTVCILDSREATEDHTITTHIRVRREPSELETLADSIDVAIYQDVTTKSRIYLVTTSGAMALNLVSIPAENNLLEGARTNRVAAAPRPTPAPAPQPALVGPPGPSGPPHDHRPESAPRRSPGRRLGPWPGDPGGPGPGGTGPGGPGRGAPHVPPSVPNSGPYEDRPRHPADPSNSRSGRHSEPTDD